MLSMRYDKTINLHAVIPCSRVNGPGKRLVVFFQGCGRGCPGCFNPDTHDEDVRIIKTPQEIFDGYLKKGVEGVTVSGGEPFEQAAGLTELLRLAVTAHGLTTVVYTGFTIEEIQKNPRLAGPLKYINVLVDGPFDETKKEPTLLGRGSMNQRLNFLDDTYTIKDFYMPAKAELIISSEGVVTGTGFGRCVSHAL